MLLRDIAILALPVITGLNGLIWAEVVARAGGMVATLCAIPASLLVAVTIYSSGLVPVGRIDPLLLLVLIALNMATSLLWLIPLNNGATRYVSLALIEGAWPVFSVLFAWLLFGRRELDVVSAMGGGLILIGAALVFHKS